MSIKYGVRTISYGQLLSRISASSNTVSISLENEIDYDDEKAKKKRNKQMTLLLNGLF
jgi:hypothetical protein